MNSNIELLQRLLIASADLQMSLSALTFLQEIDSEENYSKIDLRRFKCYETTFITAYARAFTNNRGGRYKKIDFELIGIKLEENEQKIHDRILLLRNKLYAHSDLDFAHIRLDLFKVDLECKAMDTILPQIQWDEGIEFISSEEQDAIILMLRKTLLALVQKIRTEAISSKEKMPLYLKGNPALRP